MTTTPEPEEGGFPSMEMRRSTRSVQRNGRASNIYARQDSIFYYLEIFKYFQYSKNTVQYIEIFLNKNSSLQKVNVFYKCVVMFSNNLYRSPPRPSPASVTYSEGNLHLVGATGGAIRPDDSSSVLSEKPSNLGDSSDEMVAGSLLFLFARLNKKNTKYCTRPN